MQNLAETSGGGSNNNDDDNYNNTCPSFAVVCEQRRPLLCSGQTSEQVREADLRRRKALVHVMAP
jgi:hypothetical protein